MTKHLCLVMQLLARACPQGAHSTKRRCMLLAGVIPKWAGSPQARMTLNVNWYHLLHLLPLLQSCFKVCVYRPIVENIQLRLLALGIRSVLLPSRHRCLHAIYPFGILEFVPLLVRVCTPVRFFLQFSLFVFGVTNSIAINRVQVSAELSRWLHCPRVLKRLFSRVLRVHSFPRSSFSFPLRSRSISSLLSPFFFQRVT
jgi:hypothetical protein